MKFWQQARASRFALVLQLCIRVTRKMHSFSANQTRVIFSGISSQTELHHTHFNHHYQPALDRYEMIMQDTDQTQRTMVLLNVKQLCSS